jgi:hypothetical protein
MSAVVPFDPAKAGEVMEHVLIRGDLGALTHQERARYYIRICESLGLNPMTKPFEYLTLNGKLTLYALKGATDQLRKLHGVSVAIVSYEASDSLFTVHVRAKDRDGREDEDFGVVSLPDTLKGEARANTILKAVTKAKRRVTLSLCGLGFLDETEVEDIPARAKQEVPMISSEPESAPAKPALPARIQRNVDRLNPKPGGIAERAMTARNAQTFGSTGPSEPFLASEAGKELNRRIHPMNDELPAHSAPPVKPAIDLTDINGTPAFLRRVGVRTPELAPKPEPVPYWEAALAAE